MSESPFLVLNGRAGWRPAWLDHVTLGDDGRTLRLQPLPGGGRPLVDAAGSFGGLSLPTGLAVDSRDRVYVLDAGSAQLKRFDPVAQAFAVLPCIGGSGTAPRQVDDPHGLAISRRDDIYVADTGNRRIQVFSAKGLQLRAVWGPFKVVQDADGLHMASAVPQRIIETSGTCPSQFTWPAGTWQPWDVALSAGGWAYVSDFANGLIHVFDPWGRWRRAYDGAAPGVDPLHRPTALALDAGGRLYVVQEGKDFVTVLDADGTYVAQIRRPDEVKGPFCPVAVATSPRGDLYVVDGCHATWVYCQQRDGSYACTGPCPPFVAAGGSQHVALTFDAAGQPLFCDAARLQITLLDPQASFPPSGRFYTAALDSRIYRCTWHRVTLHVALPAGAQVRVDTFTSETEKGVPELLDLPEERWSTGQLHSQVGDTPWACLVQAPPGRYLWLRLTLLGDGTASPEVRAVQVDYPRASSLGFLPAVYREDPTSADFMDRFLSIFDHFWEGISGQLAHLPATFDPLATPAGAPDGDFLTWLAGWLGLSFDRNWPVAKRRLLLANAHRLYALRGTPEGLVLHLKLFTGMEPQVLEHFKLRRWLYLNRARLGAQSALWGADIVNRLQLDVHASLDRVQLIDSGTPLHDPFDKYAHQFTVFVAAGEAQRPILERIIDMARPAHTQGVLNLIQPRFRIGIQATIGVDTLIGDYPQGVVLTHQAATTTAATGGSKLGYDTILGQSPDEAGPPTLRVGTTSRIGSGTLID